MQAAVTAALLLGLAACSPGVSEPQPEADRAAESESSNPAGLPEVSVVTPSVEPIEVEITAPGSFVAYEEATLSAETPAIVAEVRVREGTRVRRGSVLVLMEKIKAELGVKQAEAGLAQAQANFEKAKSELARKDILLSDRTISQGTFDTFKAQHDAAAAGVQGAESALALTRERLDDMTVVAPFAGVIQSKRTSPGEYVKGGDPLLVLIQVDPLKLQFEVPEKHAARLSIGQQVRTEVTALPGKIFTGEISTVFPALAVASRTIRVEALVPNGALQLKPGFYASVQVPLSPVSGSLVVPRSALFRHEGTQSVFVLRSGVAERATVRVGGETADKVEILSGLNPTDRVIVSGGETIRTGDRVRVGS